MRWTYLLYMEKVCVFMAAPGNALSFIVTTTKNKQKNIVVLKIKECGPRWQEILFLGLICKVVKVRLDMCTVNTKKIHIAC